MSPNQAIHPGTCKGKSEAELGRAGGGKGGFPWWVRGSGRRAEGCWWAKSEHQESSLGRPVAEEGERETKEAREGEKGLCVEANKGKAC